MQISECNPRLALVIGLMLALAACAGETIEPTGSSLPAPTAAPDTAPPTTTAAPAAIPQPINIATVALSDSGCEYDGPVEMAVGQLRIEMENETDGQFQLDVWLLIDNHDHEELAAHIDEERARNEAGEPPLGHPTFADLAAEASAEAGSTGELITDMAAGTYGMACILFDRPGSLGGIWAAGPITVSE